MTAQADDELWSAIADPSRRRVLDLVVSNGAVSASWLAGHVPFSRQAVSKHLAVLEQAGLVFSGLSPDGHLVEFAELPGHPFFVGTQAHPEFLSRPTRPHPLFDGLIAAALARSKTLTSASNLASARAAATA